MNIRQANLFVHRLAHAAAVQKANERRKRWPDAEVVDPQPSLGIKFHTFECIARFIVLELGYMLPDYDAIRTHLKGVDHPTDSQIAEARIREWAIELGYEDPATYEGSNVDYRRRVIAAANKYGDLILVGTRHGSPAMGNQMRAIREDRIIDAENMGKSIQGFIDNHDVFMTREEAYIVARDAGQLNMLRIKGDSDELFSEDIQ